jgi:simple sugar transport system ATP-binding protein
MRLELRAIHKSFGAVRANDGIDLTVDSATIHGLLGENGAGKSTLMKILSGFVRRDGGEILLDGKPAEIDSPSEAIRAGIGMLHQDPLDFPRLRVIDNFSLGRTDRFLQDRAGALADFRRLSKQFGFDIDPDAPAGSLTVGERQQLEIMRLLSLGAGTLILDEPTTGISPPQRTKLFETLRTLVREGLTVLFVTHKLEDARELCDGVTILRLGRVVGQLRRPFTTGRLVELMFGRQPATGERRAAEPGETVLELRGACVAGPRLRVPDINLQVFAGEVVGLAGMEGSGQNLLLRACAGLDRLASGGIGICGEKMHRRTYGEFRNRGVAYLPAGRLEEGLVPGLSLTEHFILAGRNGDFFIDWDRAQSRAREQIMEHGILGTPGSLVESLSGGNQQRALLAMLPSRLKLVLLEHPTRGLDIDSAGWVWDRLLERCGKGASIVFASADIEELFRYSDRILVFSGGRVAGPLNAGETSVGRLGELIGGGRP